MQKGGGIRCLTSTGAVVSIAHIHILVVDTGFKEGKDWAKLKK